MQVTLKKTVKSEQLFNLGKAVTQAQEACNEAYNAMMKAPKLTEEIENAYWNARDNLHLAIRNLRA